MLVFTTAARAPCNGCGAFGAAPRESVSEQRRYTGYGVSPPGAGIPPVGLGARAGEAAGGGRVIEPPGDLMLAPLRLVDPDLEPPREPPLRRDEGAGAREDRGNKAFVGALLLAVPITAFAGSRLGFVPGLLSGLGVAGVGYVTKRVIVGQTAFYSSTATGTIAPAGLAARFFRIGAERRKRITFPRRAFVVR